MFWFGLYLLIGLGTKLWADYQSYIEFVARDKSSYGRDRFVFDFMLSTVVCLFMWPLLLGAFLIYYFDPIGWYLWLLEKIHERLKK